MLRNGGKVGSVEFCGLTSRLAVIWSAAHSLYFALLFICVCTPEHLGLVSEPWYTILSQQKTWSSAWKFVLFLLPISTTISLGPPEMYAVNCLLLARTKTRQMQNDKGITEMSENVNRICLLGCNVHWIESSLCRLYRFILK